ncbi:hypothetical protein [Gorillibacterium sp. sgz500922]|uniref:hypothetical protein n=1 Tax=Gorillibacterium sp. sgz500922 TaxID=3446694 RepID=UPI003F67B7E8
MRKVLADLYNGIFLVQVSSPGAVIDYDVWTRIYENLPEGYVLPDLRTAVDQEKK